jgi:hypothetical protein
MEATQKADDALKRAGLLEDHARHAIDKAQMMERRYLEMMSRENRSSEQVEVEKAADAALKRVSVVEEQARQAIEKAQMMERRYLEMMSLENRNSERMDDEETEGHIVPVNDRMNYTTIQERNEPFDDDYDNGIDVYSMVMSEDRGNARGPLSKGNGCDTGDNGWEDDEQWEKSVGPKVPSSYDEEMTTGEKASNGRTEIPDELRPAPDVCLC